MARKKHPKPAWWKSSYFWITGALLLIAVWGLAAGPNTIADPGQTDTRPKNVLETRNLDGSSALPYLYLCAAVIMGLNGVLSHRQYVAQYKAEQEAGESLMVACMKCGGPIPKLPRWLTRVKAGFVCDSCKTKIPSASATRRQAVVPPPDDLETVAAGLDEGGMLTGLGDLGDIAALLVDDEPPADVDAAIAAAASDMASDTEAEPEPVAEIEAEPEVQPKRGRKPKAEPAPEPEPEEIMLNPLAKALKKVIAEDAAEEAKAAPKKKAAKKTEAVEEPEPVKPEPKKPGRKKKQ